MQTSADAAPTTAACFDHDNIFGNIGVFVDRASTDTGASDGVDQLDLDRGLYRPPRPTAGDRAQLRLAQYGKFPGCSGLTQRGRSWVAFQL